YFTRVSSRSGHAAASLRENDPFPWSCRAEFCNHVAMLQQLMEPRRQPRTWETTSYSVQGRSRNDQGSERGTGGSGQHEAMSPDAMVLVDLDGVAGERRLQIRQDHLDRFLCGSA